jgi:hypothetical protein
MDDCGGRRKQAPRFSVGLVKPLAKDSSSVSKLHNCYLSHSSFQGSPHLDAELRVCEMMRFEGAVYVNHSALLDDVCWNLEEQKVPMKPLTRGALGIPSPTTSLIVDRSWAIIYSKATKSMNMEDSPWRVLLISAMLDFWEDVGEVWCRG